MYHIIIMEWNFSHFFSLETSPTLENNNSPLTNKYNIINKNNTALIILNQPLCTHDHYFKAIWENAAHFRICADGGANRLYHKERGMLAFNEQKQRQQPILPVHHALKNYLSLITDNTSFNSENLNYSNNNINSSLNSSDYTQSLQEYYLPDAIAGDLDSLDPEIKSFYESHRVPIYHSSDQDSTDLEKCLLKLSELNKGTNNLKNIIIYGALGGRFDQTISAINSTLKFTQSQSLKEDYKNKTNDIQIYLASNENLSLVLLPNEQHIIRCDRELEGPSCGLLPLSSDECRIKTEGLKWDLDETMVCGFGKLISTSNTFEDSTTRSPVVKVISDKPVLWTIETKL